MRGFEPVETPAAAESLAEVTFRLRLPAGIAADGRNEMITSLETDRRSRACDHVQTCSDRRDIPIVRALPTLVSTLELAATIAEVVVMDDQVLDFSRWPMNDSQARC